MSVVSAGGGPGARLAGQGMMGAMRIVSIGDSFTEGVGDKRPDGTPVGWADRVAMGLAAAHPDQEVWYANLAVRGRLIDPIVNGQLDAALALEPPPTHLTFNGGGNDMLRPGYSDAHMIALLTRVLDACAAAGVSVVLLSGPDPSEGIPPGKRMRELSTRLTAIVEEIVAKRDGVIYVDNFGDLESRKVPYWSADRLHLNALGHQRVASRVLTAMGVPTAAPALDPKLAARRGVLGAIWFWAVYVLPWFGRRLLRKSSGDGRQAKFPTWVRVPANGEPLRGAGP